MISWEKGHWRSDRTGEEDLRLFKEELRRMSPEERAALKTLVSQVREGDMSAANQIAKMQWEETPLPIEEWLESEEHVGDLTGSFFPAVKQCLLDIFKQSAFSNDYHECIFSGSIGWGKSLLATTCIMRILYELLCLRNPPRSLGLAAGEPVYIVPISATKNLAKKVVFGGVAKKLMISPWFQKRSKIFGYEETLDEIRFRNKGIYIEGGGSNESHVLGLNVFAAIVDESNFHGKSRSKTLATDEVYDKAETIYRNLVRRVESRFQRVGVTGKLFLVSSKRSTEDFTERRIREASDDPGVFVRDFASWEVKPEVYADQKWHRVAVSPEAGRSRILGEDEEAQSGTLVIDIPDDFRPDFERNPEGSLIELAGVALEAVKPFIADRKSIDEMLSEERGSVFSSEEWDTDNAIRVNWLDFMLHNVHNDLIPKCCPSSPRHVHMDMSKNLCATGICIGHRCADVSMIRRDPRTGAERLEEVPLIHIDGALRVTPPLSGEIEHAKIRELIYTLIDAGFPIRSISCDQYCAAPNLQPFRKRGIKTSELSVIRKLDPYLALRNAIYERRIKCHSHVSLRKELRFLELSEDMKKVVFPKHSSRDLADALCGVVWYLSNNGSGGPPIAPAKGASESPTSSGSRMLSGGRVAWDGERPAGDSDSGDWGWLVT